MLEKLAGRLKWERTGDGIRVLIPAWAPWLVTFNGVWLYMVPLTTVQAFDKLRGITGSESSAPAWIGLLLCVTWFTMIFTARQVLTLNPAEMTIQVRLFGIGVRERTRATSRLRNLRFVPSGFGDFASMNAMSRIEIDRDFKTRKFAFGITEGEAETLIEKMMEVYKFPEGPGR
jgi:hypothetical protein